MFLLKDMLIETVDIQEFSGLGLDMVMQLRRQLLNWLIEIYQQKGIVIKKELKSKKNSEQKTPEDKVVNEETKIKAKEKNQSKLMINHKKKSKLKFKKTRKGF